MPVNWCPALGTVLANEEVVDGKSERGGHPVDRTPLRQWMLRITAYADRLADDLALVDWPEGTLTAQRHWIGRSEGAEIVFGVDGHPDARIAVFTTRPDTLMGATYVVLAPEHALTRTLTTPARREAVDAYVEAAARKSDLDRTALAKTKTGVPTGAFAIHPITGARLPIWVADYVLGGYGTGAVMAVPAHDERDFAFAKAFDLPIVEVVSPDGRLHDALEAAYVDDGVTVRSGEFDGLATPAAKGAVVRRARDARPRPRHGHLQAARLGLLAPALLGRADPDLLPGRARRPDRRSSARGRAHDSLRPADRGRRVRAAAAPARARRLQPRRGPGRPARARRRLALLPEGRPLVRARDQHDAAVGGLVLVLPALPRSGRRRQALGEDAYDAWMPVDLYVGGAEHAVLHLLYARFWHKVLFDLGHVKHPEPFMKLVHQGMILGEDNEKMSKSRGNVVNPDDIVREYGADALRLYEMFMGPLEAVKPWQTSQIQGVVRFRDRLFAVCRQPLVDAMDDATRRLLHRTIKKVSTDIDAMAFNTAISALMVFVNHLSRLSAMPREAVRALVLLVSPFAPHVAEELWRHLGHAASLAYEPWPAWDEALAVDDVIEIAVQVNGKVRGRVQLARDASEADARAAALAADGIAARLAGQAVRKFVYVPGKIVNLVVG